MQGDVCSGVSEPQPGEQGTHVGGQWCSMSELEQSEDVVPVQVWLGWGEPVHSDERTQVGEQLWQCPDVGGWSLRW